LGKKVPYLSFSQKKFRDRSRTKENIKQQ